MGADIMEKRLLSACFDVWKSGSFNNLVKNKATVDAHGYVIPNNHGACALVQVLFECITYRRGLRRCSFRQDGRCQSLYTWDEQQYRFPRFFFLNKVLLNQGSL